MRVSELFTSIQGEGMYAGYVTSFVRLAKCNLKCKYCDTRYAQEQEGEEMTVDEVFDSIKVRMVCITGGEPLLQAEEVVELCRLLDRRGYTTVIETNGAVPIPLELISMDKVLISMDWKCPSSGVTSHMLEDNLDIIRPKDQLKFVISDMKDLDYVQNFLPERELLCNIVFQPVAGGAQPRALKMVADWMVKKQFSEKYRLSVQIHKLAWGDKRCR